MVEQRPLRVVQYIFFPQGGIARYTHELARHLVEYPDLLIEVACPDAYAWRAGAGYDVWTHLQHLGRGGAVRRRLRFLLAQWQAPRMLCRHVETSQADIVHFQNVNHLTWPFWRRRLERSRAISAITVHDVQRQKAMLNRSYEERQLRQVYRYADALFVHGEHQKKELIEFADVSRERVTIVPHGVYSYGKPSADADSLRQKYGLPRDARVALFFGHVRDEKNLDLLIRLLPRHRSELHLFVAGPHGAKGQRPLSFYENLARELGVSSSITFVRHYIPDEEVADLFEVCDWVALPYSRRFTSQSGVLNVAAACRRPVVVAGGATLAETLARCDIGVFVEPDDIESLDSGIREMHRRLSVGHEHQFDRYGREFGWAENARRTREVYWELARAGVRN